MLAIAAPPASDTARTPQSADAAGGDSELFSAIALQLYSLKVCRKAETRAARAYQHAEVAHMTDNEVAAATAVASIHEEEISLDGLSIDELEKLRDRIEVVLAQKFTQEIPLEKFYFDAPDDRSMGEIRFEAKTSLGIFRYKGFLLSDGHVESDEVCVLNPGTDFEEDVEDYDGWYTALNSDVSENEAKAIIVKSLLDWQKAREEAADELRHPARCVDSNRGKALHGRVRGERAIQARNRGHAHRRRV